MPCTIPSVGFHIVVCLGAMSLLLLVTCQLTFSLHSSWIGQRHHNIVTSLSGTFVSSRKRSVLSATAYLLKWYRHYDVRMVLHIVKSLNGFLQWGGVKHFSPGAMTGCNLHRNNIVIKFGVYSQIAKNKSLQEWGLTFCWATQATWLVASCSLLWTLVPLWHVISGWFSLCHYRSLNVSIFLASVDLPFWLSPTGMARILTITHRKLFCLGMKMWNLLLNALPKPHECQEWTRTLMSSPQEWRWIVKAKAMSQKSITRLKLPSSAQ